MKIDPTKSAVQNLLALIDASNPSAPKLPSQVTVSNLITGTFPNGGDTQVTLTGTGPQGSTANFVGSVNVSYKRLTLAAEAAVPSTAVPIPFGTTGGPALLALAANYYGFVPAEISWSTVPTKPTGGLPQTSTATLKANGSFIYEDGTTNISLSWQPGATVALLHFDGTNGSTSIVDAQGHPFTAAGSAALSTAQSKFGGSSLLMGTTGTSTVTTPDATGLRLGGSDCTVEAWVYITNATNNSVLFSKKAGSGFPYSHFTYQAGSWFLYAMTTNNTATLQGTSKASVNTWVHIALVCRSGTWYIYENGVLLSSLAVVNPFGNNTDPFMIGNWGGMANQFTGYIDEFRISNIARYTAAFTPPTAAFVLD